VRRIRSCSVAFGVTQTWTWVGSIHGSDWVGLGLSTHSLRDFSSVGSTITDARARLSAAKVEAIELVRWGLRASLISSSS